MKTQLVELQDGILIEVDAPPNQADQISGGMPDQVNQAIDTVRPILLKACRPIIETWKELNRDMSIDNAEVELQLGFSAEGSVFLAKTSGSANLKIKLSLSPKNEEA